MTAANRLTVLRLLLIPCFLVFVVQTSFWPRCTALLLFCGAALTDLYDGILARRTRSITTLGILLDPVADKLLISAALVVFVQLHDLHVPAWMVIIILSREFLITGLRGVAAARGQILGAERAGKFKTTSQVISIIVILTVLTVRSAIAEWGIPFQQWTAASDGRRWAPVMLEWLPYWMMWITTVLTGVSGGLYLRRHWDVVLETASSRG